MQHNRQSSQSKDSKYSKDSSAKKMKEYNLSYVPYNIDDSQIDQMNSFQFPKKDLDISLDDANILPDSPGSLRSSLSSGNSTAASSMGNVPSSPSTANTSVFSGNSFSLDSENNSNQSSKRRVPRHSHSASEIISSEEIQALALFAPSHFIPKKLNFDTSYKAEQSVRRHSDFGLSSRYPLIDLESGDYSNTTLDNDSCQNYKDFMNMSYTWMDEKINLSLESTLTNPNSSLGGTRRMSLLKQKSFSAISEVEEEEDLTSSDSEDGSAQKFTFFEFIKNN